MKAMRAACGRDAARGGDEGARRRTAVGGERGDAASVAHNATSLVSAPGISAAAASVGASKSAIAPALIAAKLAVR